MIFWPTSTRDESPKVTGKSFSAGASIWITATSLEASAPMTFAAVGRAVEERDPDGIGPLDDVEVGQDVPLLVDDEARAGARRGLVAEEALALGLGGDVDDALVHLGVDEDVVPLLGVEVLEHVVGRGGVRLTGAWTGGTVRPESGSIGTGTGGSWAGCSSTGICTTGGWRRSPRRPPKSERPPASSVSRDR